MIGLFVSAWQLVVRRSLANWRLLSTVLIGVVMAVTLLASAPLYAQALSSLGLAHQLRQRPPELLDVQVLVFNEPAQREAYAAVDDRVSGEATQQLDGILRGRSRYLRSSVFYLATLEETDRLVQSLTTQEEAGAALFDATEAVSQTRLDSKVATDAAVASQSAEATAALDQTTKETDRARTAAFEARARLDSAQMAAEQAQRAVLLAERALVPGDQRRQLAYERAQAAETAALEAVTKARRDVTQTGLVERVANIRLDRAKQDALRSQDPALSRTAQEAAARVAEVEQRVKEETQHLAALRQATRELWQNESRDRAYMQALSGLEDHVRLVAGAYPALLAVPEDEEAAVVAEVLVGAATADQLGLEVGSQVVVLPAWEETRDQLLLRVAGIIEPNDPKEEYWLLEDPFRLGDPEQGWHTASFFVSEESFLDGLGGLFPAHEASTLAWRFYVDADRVPSQDATVLQDDLGAFQRGVLTGVPGSQVLTVLDKVLEDYRTKLLLTRIPVYLVLLQVVGIILYYLTMVTNMLVERRAADVALLQERGASMGQVLVLHAMEALLLCGAAFVIGPLLAQAMTAVLGKTAAFRALSGGGLLPVELSPDVFLLAALASGLSFLALLAPTIQVSRQSLVAQRGSLARPARLPWWQRFNLDLAALVLGGLFYWQVSRQGALLGRTLFGELSFDPLQLLTPTFLMVATAIAFLRLFPLMLALFSRWLARDLPVTAYLGLLYVGRNPLPYTRLILLLTLVTAVGFFVALFGGTLGRSIRERIAYVTGSDIRVANVANFERGRGAFLATYSGMDGVDRAMPVYRGTARVAGRTAAASAAPTLLGVDTEAFAGMAWFRGDFADQRLSDLMPLLQGQQSAPEGRPLPNDARQVRLWVQPFPMCAVCQLYLRLGDADDTYWNVHVARQEGDVLIEAMSSPDWQQFTMDLPAGAPPFRLLGFWLRSTAPSGGLPVGGVRLDAVEALNAAVAVAMVEDFDSGTIWEVRPRGTGLPAGQAGAQAQVDSFSADPQNVLQGRFSGRLQWRAGGGTPGLQLPRRTVPIPAIASNSFLKAANLSPKGRPLLSLSVSGSAVQVQVVAAVEYFPTLDPAGFGFLVTDLGQLSRAANAAPTGDLALYPNEAWIASRSRGAARDDLRERLLATGTASTKVYDEIELLSRATTDPLTSAGWRGVLNLAFLAAAGVGALGFMIYAYLFAQRRQLEFAVLRTMGFSARQTGLLVSFELLVIVVLGVTAGSLIGGVLGRVMLPFMQLTELGEQVLPPFVLAVGWGEVLRIYGILVLAFLVASGATTRFFSRLAITRVIRIGE